MVRRCVTTRPRHCATVPPHHRTPAPLHCYTAAPLHRRGICAPGVRDSPPLPTHRYRTSPHPAALREIDLLTDAWMPGLLPGLSLVTGASLGLSTASLIPPTLAGLDLDPFLDDLTSAELLLDHTPTVASTVRHAPPAPSTPCALRPLRPAPFAPLFLSLLPYAGLVCALTAPSDPSADEPLRRWLVRLARLGFRRECPFRGRPCHFCVAGRPRHSFG